MSTSPRERQSAPRYIRHQGQWYISKEHMQKQLETAILSAFHDGLEHAGRPHVPLIALEAAQ